MVGYSRAIRVGRWVSVAGTTAAAEGGGAVGGQDIGELAREALKRIEAALQQAGARLEDVERTRMFVTDISRWEEVGRAHGEVFGSVRPATSMLEVNGLIDPALLVEIEADAVVITDPPSGMRYRSSVGTRNRHGVMRAPSAACVLAVGAALLLASPAAGHSGICGLVTVSTHCGPDVSGEPPSPPAPFDADVLVRARATHDLVATVRSGRDGRWRVQLRPGRYLVEPGRARGGGLGFTKQSSVRVTVRRHHDWPRVDFFYNNGCL